MENLLDHLEKMNISNELWSQSSMDFIQNTYCPQQEVGLTRPCDENDFVGYRSSIDNNLQAIHLIIQRILEDQLQTNENSNVVKTIGIHSILIVGEQHKISPWNTARTPNTAENILKQICQLFGVENLSQLLSDESNDHLLSCLLILKPKLLQDTWRTFPAAVECYKWILHQVQGPALMKHMPHILPTALIVYDDYVPENRIIGLECIYHILQNTSMQDEFINKGYNDVLYDALEKLTHQRDVRYIIPLYVCLTQLLVNFDAGDKSANCFEWTRRDSILGTLLDNMELEQDLERRHAYMKSLSQFLTNLGCAKWCERITRIIAEYCGHHTDLRTLRATLQAAETVLTTFNLRVPAHCATLYSAFLKLHLDLVETPIFDEEILKSLERCIYMLYKLTPAIGSTIIRDNRLRAIMKNSLYSACQDTKYCN